MHYTMIDRKQVKRENKQLLKTAQVSPKALTVFYLGISMFLSVCTTFLPSMSLFSLAFDMASVALEPLLIVGTFVSILVTLMLQVLTAGYTLYCMGIYKGEHMDFGNLFDGFAFASKIVSLMILEFFYVWAWSLLFVFPGIIAAYRYRFALLNLCENPELSAGEALALSKKQTKGYKLQVFMLDLSFIPWMLLAQLPTFVLYGSAFEVVSIASLIPQSLLVQNLIIGLWSLVVMCFYLPLYQTSEVAYFEIAKESFNGNYNHRNDPDKEIWE
ncbi:DUF975 family protein [Bengtsoniella intestinalis]|uniref:DUF975 family protein n=1 Tax=Bengtsoniella intestinalis TaxID=3073143 RepID=UPI00391F20C7